jgi:hypothetical protein
MEEVEEVEEVEVEEVGPLGLSSTRLRAFQL